MTTLFALAALSLAPPAWTQFANFDDAVVADREAFQAIEDAEGRVIVRSESRVLASPGSGRVVAGIGGQMQVGAETIPLVKVSFEDEPSRSAWLMQVSTLQYVNRQPPRFEGRIGPNSVRQIIALVDGLRKEYGDTGPINDSGPTSVNFRSGNSTVTYDFRQTSITAPGFFVSIQASDWGAVKSEWQKLPGVKVD